MDNRFKLATGRGRVEHYSGVFEVNGTSAVSDSVDSFGAGLEIERTGTGKITLTFPVFFDKVYGYRAELNLASATSVSFAQVDSFTANSSGKAVMVIGTYGTATAADFTGRISWSCDVRR
jgi:hypothetical protein